MLIEIHMIQNHSPSNMNRDDLGAPKTCLFGGVQRARISSQCLKRSIRTGEEFRRLLGGVATRRLAQLIAGEDEGKQSRFDKAFRVLALCGIGPKDKKGRQTDASSAEDEQSAARVFTTRRAVERMGELLADDDRTDAELAEEFAHLIADETAVPDMALCGRMLEPKKPAKPKKGKAAAASEGGQGKDAGETSLGVWQGLKLTVDAALQAAHAISTHAAQLEIDYFVAADDIPGEDAGAAYVDEALFSSACFYKYFTINWEALVDNLAGFEGEREALAAHTVGAFLRGAALTTPTGKQNSFAAHNPPDAVLVQLRRNPVSYANAFAAPVSVPGPRDMVAQSIAQLGQYVHDLDTGYGKPEKRVWFSPNLRHRLTVNEDEQELGLADVEVKTLDDLVVRVVEALGFEWDLVREVTVA